MPAFKIEFEEVAAAMPPLPKLVFSRSTDADPLVSVRQRMEAFSLRLDDWQSDVKLWMPALRALFERAADANDADSIHLLHRHLPRLLATHNEILDEADNSLLELRKLFLLIRSRLEPDALPSVTIVEAAVDEAFAKLRKIVGDVLDEIKTIDWDFDPSARGGNRSFNNPDDLIAFLNS